MPSLGGRSIRCSYELATDPEGHATSPVIDFASDRRIKFKSVLGVSVSEVSQDNRTTQDLVNRHLLGAGILSRSSAFRPPRSASTRAERLLYTAPAHRRISAIT